MPRPAASIDRLQPRRNDTIIATLQLTLDLPVELAPETRSDLALALERRAATPQKSWYYVMLNPQQQRNILKAITSGPRAGLTTRVWLAAISAVRYDTGAIDASIGTLAEYAATTPAEASRAMSRLADIDALVRKGRGRYLINPNVAWSGDLNKRERAANQARPVLSVVSAA